MHTDDALLFIKLAETQSFKASAAQLGISRSAASKRIALLEKALGTTLINRTPRSLSLTHTGTLVLEQCRKMCEAIENVQQAVHGHGMQPVGALQIALPTPLGVALLPTLMHEFVRSYPKVTLSVHLVDGSVDIVAGGYDVAFTVSRRLADSSLSAQRLIMTRQVLAASPTYLRRNGTPTKVQELVKHKCLGMGYAGTKHSTWQFFDVEPLDVHVRYAVTFNNYLLLSHAACQDMGFIYVPDLFVRNEMLRGQLVSVLPAATAHVESGLFSIYPRRDPPEKVRAIVDFVKARLGQIAEPSVPSDSRPRIVSVEGAEFEAEAISSAP